MLVADDHDDTRELYAEILRVKGYRVEEASTGTAALARARKMRPELVLMDLSLPKMDGWEVTRRLKMDDRTKHIIVLIVSGHAEASARDRALEAGCDDFYAKPCLPMDLAAHVRRALDAR